MKGINFGRVVLGGILAGIILNISEYVLNDMVLKNDWDAAMKAIGKTMPGGAAIVVWILYGFALGIAAVWLYAAIRPRFGAGAGTAAKAGIAVWFFQCLLPHVAQLNLHLFPNSIALTSMAWGLVELLIATVLGAWIYREAA